MSKDFFIDLLYIDKLSVDNRSENQYKLDNDKINKVYPVATPRYEIIFKKKAFSEKRKFYVKLINSETIVRFNRLINALDVLSTDEHLKYLYHKYHKDFTTYLRHISNYIKENDLSENQFINPSNSHKADESYIVFYLKANAILLFLELQERFHKYSDIDYLNEDDIYEAYFNEKPPTTKDVIAYSGESIKTAKKLTKKGNSFNPIKGDLSFRQPDEKLLAFDQIIASNKADNFMRLEAQLYDNGIINNEYNFVTDKGNKQILAAFILKLYKTGYINQRVFSKNKPAKEIKGPAITKFFTNRYGANSNANKEFRNFQLSQKHKYDKIISSYHWLDQIS